MSVVDLRRLPRPAVGRRRRPEATPARRLLRPVRGRRAGGFDSPFEREVFEELCRRGLTLHKQVGCGGFKIDTADVDEV